MDGPLGGGDPEFLGVFFHVGFRGGINRKASSGVDVFIYVLVHSFYAFLYHSQYGYWRAKLPSIRWDHCGHHEGLSRYKWSNYDPSVRHILQRFILMLALLPTFVSIVLVFFVRIHEANTIDDTKHLNGFPVVALIIAAYLIIILTLENTLSLPSWAHIITFILLLLLLASPIGIAIKAQMEDSKRFVQTFSIESNPLKENPELMSSSESYHELHDGEGQVNAAVDDTILIDEEGMNLFQAMCTLNFWLLFMAMVCGMGSGQAVINNLSQIGQSLNYTTVEVNNLVSLWSIWNFVGRIGVGYLSDYLLHARGWARPLLMSITLATMITGHIVIASGFPGILYMGSILVGICYGSQWALMPTITSDIFGVRHLGTISTTIGVACPVGSYIFSVRVIGYIYDMEAGGEGYSSCFGTHCFMLSFIIMASLALLGSLVAIALFFRTKIFYQRVVLRRLKQYSLR
uniref:Uncharacterized protein n=1 Tax=Fagus sylvatica TaxID=28930 RepID=A0A2N9I7W6_FAGSY